ncbi:hypothetical protein ACLBOM_13655 [Escherichia coli]
MKGNTSGGPPLQGDYCPRARTSPYPADGDTLAEFMPMVLPMFRWKVTGLLFIPIRSGKAVVSDVNNDYRNQAYIDLNNIA